VRDGSRRGSIRRAASEAKRRKRSSLLRGRLEESVSRHHATCLEAAPKIRLIRKEVLEEDDQQDDQDDEKDGSDSYVHDPPFG
jgi:hypothetical protein